jgi:hypothetical protein
MKTIIERIDELLNDSKKTKFVYDCRACDSKKCSYRASKGMPHNCPRKDK